MIERIMQKAIEEQLFRVISPYWKSVLSFFGCALWRAISATSLVEKARSIFTIWVCETVLFKTIRRWRYVKTKALSGRISASPNACVLML